MKSFKIMDKTTLRMTDENGNKTWYTSRQIEGERVLEILKVYGRCYYLYAM